MNTVCFDRDEWLLAGYVCAWDSSCEVRPESARTIPGARRVMRDGSAFGPKRAMRSCPGCSRGSAQAGSFRESAATPPPALLVSGGRTR
jgi:hypothetical protein